MSTLAPNCSNQPHEAAERSALNEAVASARASRQKARASNREVTGGRRDCTRRRVLYHRKSLYTKPVCLKSGQLTVIVGFEASSSARPGSQACNFEGAPDFWPSSPRKINTLS